MKEKNIVFIFLLSLLIIYSCGIVKNEEIGQYKNGIVVSAHPLANAIGLDVLKAGGNAFDAAVAVNMALAVTYPRAGNIGGGGFMVYHKSNGESGTLDYREKAAGNANRDMYLDLNGEVVKDLSRLGALSIGVPGTVAGMVALHEKLGQLPWKFLLKPSIDLATRGFPISNQKAELLNKYKEIFNQENNDKIYLVNNNDWKAGDTLKALDLAATLNLLSVKKTKGFYEGPIAQDIVNTIRKHGGLITLEDLKNYKVVWRDPIINSFKEFQVISMPPPSSGGIALIQLLKGFEQCHGDTLKHNSALYIHLLTELERRVYADRAEYLGDPDYFPVPVDVLLDSNYLLNRFSDISMLKATPSLEIKEGVIEKTESFETTHFEIVDQWGNAVAITTTLNGHFGSKLMAEKSGFLLNNEMDDFSAKPGVPNQFDLVGSVANQIEPGKRMLSSMTPTIVLKNDSVVLLTGTPGGAKIITTVFQTILNSLVYEMNAQQAVNRTKVHSQWLPDQIYFEAGKMDSEKEDSLTNMGHQLFAVQRLGKMKLILINEGVITGAGDTLRGDPQAIGY
jgi:gamma-glutamyltranspeptidase/glutathione hydrolase